MSAIQARIKAFESLGTESTSQTASRKPPVSLYETEEDIPNVSHVSDGTPARQSSLNVDEKADEDARSLAVGSITSDFVKVSPPRSRPPPLPPRKGSENSASSSGSGQGGIDVGSFKSVSSTSSIPKGPPTPRPIPLKSIGRNSPSNGSSSSLAVQVRGHQHAVSTSSFHSVSLSEQEYHEKDESEVGLGGSYEAVSPHASSVFTMVDRSSSVMSSPALSAVSLGPPALPPRPSPSPSALGTSTLTLVEPPLSHPAIPVPYAVRKVPPPPPSGLQSNRSLRGTHRPPPLENISRNSPRSSMTSMTGAINSPLGSSHYSSEEKRSSTSTSASNFNARSMAKSKRPPPPPPAARARYEAVFDANIRAQQEWLRAGGPGAKRLSSTRRAVGWRGTSVDLTTTDVQTIGEVSGGQEQQLSGSVIKLIWRCSKLPRSTLKAIWDECDTAKKGSLNKQAFVAGMWRIDNELLAAASIRTPSATPFRGPAKVS